MLQVLDHLPGPGFIKMPLEVQMLSGVYIC